MFKVIEDIEHYRKEARDYKEARTNIELRPGQDLDSKSLEIPHKFPCLVKFYTTHVGPYRNQYICTAKCSKNTAKSIVYPDTNQANSADWFRLSGLEAYTGVVEYLKLRNACSIINDVGIMSEIRVATAIKQPYLLGHKILISRNQTKVLEMVVVTKVVAKKLVYYGKIKPKRRMTINISEGLYTNKREKQIERWDEIDF